MQNAPVTRTAQVVDALTWAKGFDGNAIDADGRSVLAAYGPIEFMGTRWAVVAELDAKEVLAPVTALRNRFDKLHYICES